MVIQVYFLFTLVDNTTWFNSNFQTPLSNYKTQQNDQRSEFIEIVNSNKYDNKKITLFSEDISFLYKDIHVQCVPVTHISKWTLVKHMN